MDCIDTQSLHYFAALADEGHLRNAARRLGVSVWRLKRVIKQLESQFEEPLLWANGPTLKLTSEGRALLVSARAVLACRHSTPSVLTHRTVADQLTIGVLSDGLPDLVTRILAEFHFRFPNVALRIRESSTNGQMYALENMQMDVGFVREPQHVGKTRLEPLSDDPLCVILPPHHQLLAFQTVALERLADESFIIPRRDRNDALVNQITGLCGQAGFRPRVSHETYQLETLLALVSAGLGIAIVPRPDSTRAQDELYRPLTLDGEIINARVPLMMVWQGSSYRPALAHFLKLARQVASPSRISR